MVAFRTFFVVLNPLAAPCWLPQTDLTVESASNVMLSSPLSSNHRAFFDSNNICNLRAPPCPSFFNVADIVFSFIALSNFSKARTKPSPVNEAILQMRFIPQKEDMAIEIKIWFTPNFVALCHSVGNKVLNDFIIPCLFIYFATVLSPEYFVMLLPENEYFTTLDCPINFFFVFFILKVIVFCFDILL